MSFTDTPTFQALLNKSNELIREYEDCIKAPLIDQIAELTKECEEAAGLQLSTDMEVVRLEDANMNLHEEIDRLKTEAADTNERLSALTDAYEFTCDAVEVIADIARRTDERAQTYQRDLLDAQARVETLEAKLSSEEQRTDYWRSYSLGLEDEIDTVRYGR